MLGQDVLSVGRGSHFLGHINLVRPPQFRPLAALIFDGSTRKSLLPKVIYQPKDVQRSLGIIIFKASTKQFCLDREKDPKTHFVLDEARIRPGLKHDVYRLISYQKKTMNKPTRAQVVTSQRESNFSFISAKVFSFSLSLHF